MKINRRELLRTCGYITIAAGIAPVMSAQPESKTLPDDFVITFSLLRPEDDPEFGATIRGDQSTGGSVVGTAPSRHDEIRTAFKILLDAPRDATVIDTARYFEKITQKNQDGELYNWEWEKRSNPLITGMFAATGTAPSFGDQTYWCAAFVSFCLYLANKPNKYTALSGGYRTFGTEPHDPLPGDIAIFTKIGEEGTKGFGHIGFFIRNESRNGKNGILVLGGNQRGNTKSTGAVIEAWYPLEGNNLALHSIRRIPGG